MCILSDATNSKWNEDDWRIFSMWLLQQFGGSVVLNTHDILAVNAMRNKDIQVLQYADPFQIRVALEE